MTVIVFGKLLRRLRAEYTFGAARKRLRRFFAFKLVFLQLCEKLIVAAVKVGKGPVRRVKLAF